MTYFPNKKVNLKDVANRSNLFTAFGENVVTSKKDYVSAQFHYNLAADKYTISTTGSGSYQLLDSQLIVTTGNTSDSLIKITTKDYVAYESGHEIYAMFTAEFDSVRPSNTYQYIGIFDDYDGFYLGYEDSQFGIGWRKNQNDTFIPQSSFSLDKLNGTGTSGFTIDTTKGNLYMITFGWLGVAPVVFWVHGGYERGWIPFHVIDIINVANGPTVLNPILPMRIEAYSLSSSSSVQIKSNCWVGGLYTDVSINEQPNLRLFAQDGLKTITANTTTNILTLQNVLTYNSKPNKISCFVTGFSFTTDNGVNQTNKPVKLSVYREAAFTGTPTWNPVNTDSIIDFSTNQTTYTAGTGKLIFATGIVSNDGSYVKFDNPVKLYPGDKLSFTAWSSTSNTVNIVANWYEDF